MKLKVKLRKLSAQQLQSLEIAERNAVDQEHQLKFVHPRKVREQLKQAMREGEIQHEKQ